MTYETTRLAEVMTAVQGAVITHFDASGVDLPGWQYTTVGTPAVDGEQFVVYLQRIFAGTPGLERQDPQLCAEQRVAELVVELTRCVAVASDDGEPPSAATLAADGAVLITDAWLLRRAVEAMSSPGGDGYNMSVLESRPLEPAGGLAGSVVVVQVEL